MGTRADFYIGRGTEAEWLGSIAWDGHPDSQPEKVCRATSLEDFLAEVKELHKVDDWTHPELGWPWPWEDSRTTDYAYAWDDGVWVSCFGHGWVSGQVALEAMEEGEDPWSEGKTAVFPETPGELCHQCCFGWCQLLELFTMSPLRLFPPHHSQRVNRKCRRRPSGLI